jgi:hypothetical protein
MATIQYFAYGSNMLTERLQRRCPSARPKRVAVVDNWALAFCKRGQDGSAKATLASTAESRVFGVVFDLDESDLPTLDRFEGAGSGYDRIDDFQVHAQDLNRPLNLVTYIASADHTDPSLKPFDWYLGLVVAGARQHAFSPEYIGAVEAIPSVNDPMPDRPSRQEALELLKVTPF